MIVFFSHINYALSIHLRMSTTSSFSTKKPYRPSPIYQNRLSKPAANTINSTDFPNLNNTDKSMFKKPVSTFTLADKLKKQIEIDAVKDAAKKAEAARLAVAKQNEERNKLTKIPTSNYFNKDRYSNESNNDYDNNYSYDDYSYNHDIDDFDYVAPHMIGKNKEKPITFTNEEYYETEDDNEYEMNSELYDY